MRQTLLLSLALATPAAASTYYLAPAGGSDSGPGSQAAPFASFTKALAIAQPGDTIYLRGGTYTLSSRWRINKDGTQAAPITLAAFENETPILDFATNPTAGQRGIQLDANHWRLTGLTIQNAPDNGVHITGSYNTLTGLTTRYNKDSGIQIAAGSIGAPSRNLITHTDSYENYDPQAHGENADGFAVKFRGIGPGNTIRNARAWGNSDDGFDFWAASQGVTVENSWAFRNGINKWNDSAFAGDGNGFKLGHDSGAHSLSHVAVWDNPANGIDINGNATALEYPDEPITHGVSITNATAFHNGFGFNGRNFQFDETFAHSLQNNISLGGNKPDLFSPGLTQSQNTWNLTPTITATPEDFLSLTDTNATAPRGQNYALPTLPFLHLTPTSDLKPLGAFPIPDPTTATPLLLTLPLLRRR